MKVLTKWIAGHSSRAYFDKVCRCRFLEKQRLKPASSGFKRMAQLIRLRLQEIAKCL